MAPLRIQESQLLPFCGSTVFKGLLGPPLDPHIPQVSELKCGELHRVWFCQACWLAHPAFLPISHWPKYSHMTPAYCTRSWELWSKCAQEKVLGWGHLASSHRPQVMGPGSGSQHSTTHLPTGHPHTSSESTSATGAESRLGPETLHISLATGCLIN